MAQLVEVAGPIPDGVNGNFYWHNPSDRTVAVVFTQPLTEMKYQEYFLGVRSAGAQGLQPYHLHVSAVLKSEIWEPEPPGTLRACPGL